MSGAAPRRAALTLGALAMLAGASVAAPEPASVWEPSAPGASLLSSPVGPAVPGSAPIQKGKKVTPGPKIKKPSRWSRFVSRLRGRRVRNTNTSTFGGVRTNQYRPQAGVGRSALERAAQSSQHAPRTVQSPGAQSQPPAGAGRAQGVRGGPSSGGRAGALLPSRPSPSQSGRGIIRADAGGAARPTVIPAATARTSQSERVSTRPIYDRVPTMRQYDRVPSLREGARPRPARVQYSALPNVDGGSSRPPLSGRANVAQLRGKFNSLLKSSPAPSASSAPAVPPAPRAPLVPATSATPAPAAGHHAPGANVAVRQLKRGHYPIPGPPKLRRGHDFIPSRILLGQRPSPRPSSDAGGGAPAGGVRVLPPQLHRSRRDAPAD